MKLTKLMTMLAVMAGGLWALPANATYVPIGDNNGQLYAGTITSDEYGYIALQSELTTNSNGSLSGYIAPDTTVSFDYDIVSSIPGNYYSFIENETDARFAYAQYSTQAGGGVNAAGISYGVAPQVFATANVTGPLSIITLTNLSTAPAYFNLDYDNSNTPGHKLNGISSIHATYGIQPTPLPASFPLFAAVMAGLVGVAAYRKKRDLQA